MRSPISIKLSAEDPLIRNLARIMRDGRGASLEDAVKEAWSMPTASG